MILVYDAHVSLRLALARLVATPLFTIFSVLSLAVGVAVTTAVYSVVDTLILTELGIADPESATIIATASGGRLQQGSVSAMDFEDLKKAVGFPEYYAEEARYAGHS